LRGIFAGRRTHASGIDGDSGPQLHRYLSAALYALLVQTFTDFELLLSDNGSTDESPHICRSVPELDGRIAYVRDEVNRGLAFARQGEGGYPVEVER
jgi:hypothetical protein